MGYHNDPQGGRGSCLSAPFGEFLSNKDYHSKLVDLMALTELNPESHSSPNVSEQSVSTTREAHSKGSGGLLSLPLA